MRMRRLAMAGLAVSVFGNLGTAAPRAAGHHPEVWMSAFEPPWRAVKGWPPNDYMQLFEPDAPWLHTAKGVKVFELYKLFVERSSDEELSKVLADLSRRGIALSMQGTPLTASNACGRTVESYGPPHDMRDAAARIKRLGGKLAFIALDEPLYYGHAFKGRPAMKTETQPPTPCFSTITELARETAAKLAEVREIFPDVAVGDVEPLGVFETSSGEFRGMFAEWLKAYEAATSRKFAFVDLDAAWLLPAWQSQFDDAARRVREEGIPLGVIFGGTRADSTDAAWLASARAHIELVESKLGGPPDRAIFQSWTDHPRRLLPETDPATFTNLIKTYLDSH